MTPGDDSSTSSHVLGTIYHEGPNDRCCKEWLEYEYDQCIQGLMLGAPKVLMLNLSTGELNGTLSLPEEARFTGALHATSDALLFGSGRPENGFMRECFYDCGVLCAKLGSLASV